MGEVNDDGIMMVSALNMLTDGTLPILKDFWPFLTDALSKTDNPELFRSGLMFLGEFFRVTKENVAEKADTFLPQILEVFENSVDEKTKITILETMSDCFLFCGDHARKYFSRTVRLVLEYYKELEFLGDRDSTKESILDFISSSMHGKLAVAEEIGPFACLIMDIISSACIEEDLAMAEKGLLSISDMRQFHKADEQIRRTCVEGLETIKKAKQLLKMSSMNYSQTLMYVDMSFKDL